MSKETFKIVALIKNFILVKDKNLTNFPKREIELKQEINKCSYSLLLFVQEGNITSDMKKRIDLIESSIAMVRQLDFLLSQCYDRQIINAKRYYKFGESLDTIIRYLVVWLNATKQSHNRA